MALQLIINYISAKKNKHTFEWVSIWNTTHKHFIEQHNENSKNQIQFERVQFESQTFCEISERFAKHPISKSKKKIVFIE